MAVRATVKAPCHGTFPLTRMADFLAAARYFRVGIVMRTMMMFGTKAWIILIMVHVDLQPSVLKPWSQM